MTPMPFQIRHIVPHAGRIGGYERQARLIARAQAGLGHAVAIVTHAEKSALTDPHTNSDPSILTFPIRKRFTRFDQRDIQQAVAAADVLHVHALDPLSAEVVLAGRSKGIPAVVKIATRGDVFTFASPESHPPNVATPRPFESLRSTLQKNTLKRAWAILKDAEAFIALNDAIRNELITLGIRSNRIHRMPNAVEIPAQPVKLDPSNQSAVCVGRLIERKRVDQIIDAFLIVRSTHQRARLTVVGDGPDRFLLEQRARDFGLDEAIEFAGALADPTPVLHRSALFILASELEGCPNALLEAAAAGLPCIATTIPGVVEYFDESTMSLIPMGNPRALADAWADLLTNHEKCTSLSEAARRRLSQSAGLDRMLERYHGLYAQLVSMTPGA